MALGSAVQAQSVTSTGAAGISDTVARGAHLARVGDCVSCHTAAGGRPFAGGYKLDYLPRQTMSRVIGALRCGAVPGLLRWT